MEAADRLRAAARATGVLEDDPLAVLVDALADAVHQVTRGQEILVSSADELPGRLISMLAVGREAAAAEADRFRTELVASEADVVRRVGRAIVEAADSGLARHGRALDRRTGLLVGLVLVGAIASAGSAGWWTGREAGRSDVASIAADVRGIFSQGTDAADAWRDLILWNDLHSALQACQDPSNAVMVAGRRACRVPLWLSRQTSPSD